MARNLRQHSMPVVLARQHLEARLDESFGRRLTLLTAGAGFGKSTLLARWTEDLLAAWHTVSAQDVTLSSFATGIARAMRSYLPVLPHTFNASLARSPDELARAELLAALLSDALEPSLVHDVVLVLDDAHEIASSPAALRFIESLCRQAPATLHLVIAARRPLALRVDRLRAQGSVLEITGPELAFSLGEIESLLPSSLRDDDGLAQQIYETTGGWPAAARLTIEVLAATPVGEHGAALEKLRRSGSPLLAYLAHDVFDRESPDVQALIRTVAPLDWFSVELCEALGLDDAREVLDGLQKRGLFVQERRDGLVLHELVREFALSDRPLPEEERLSIHVRAAEWFESRGRIPEALRAFGAAPQPIELARLLAAHGAALIAAGGTETVIELGCSLSAELRSPEIEQLLGEALLAGGDFGQALACFERAAWDGTDIDAGLAWRLVMTHHLRTDFDSAIATYVRATGDDGDEPDVALLLGWVASSYLQRGEPDAARPLVLRSLEIARSCGDDRALAAAEVSAGTMALLDCHDEAVDDHLRTAFAAAERCGDFQQLGRIHINRTALLTDRGSYEAALEELDAAMKLTEAPGLIHAERAMTNRGRIHLRLGLLDEARAAYEAVVETSRRTGSRERAHGFTGLGEVHRERGNLAQAWTAYHHALGLAASLRDIHSVVPLQGLARVLIDEAPVDARRLAEEAVARPGQYRAWALNTLGWVALALGEREEAARAALEAARLARERNDSYALAEALQLDVFASDDPKSRASRLHEALAIWRELGSRVRIAECELALARLGSGAEAQAAEERAERKLRTLGVRIGPSGPAGLLRMIAVPVPAAVSIQTLGGFRVLRGGIPVPRSDWPSKKPRELLKILVCRRGRAAPRELLMEILWPNEEPAKLGNRLSVALSTLRSVLDPERRFEPEHFVRSERESIALELETVVVDVEVFLHSASTGSSLFADGEQDEAATWLEQAESAYAGDVLEDDPYGDWAVALREEARTTYVAVAHTLAQRAAAAGDDNAATRYYLRILGYDPYDETAHLGFVSALERSGRRGEARRSYRVYVARMEEIGASPAAFPARAAPALKGT